MKRSLADQNATEEFARRLAAHASAGDVIALHGDLGMGKSVFCRSFIRALTTPDEEVPSPTFTLVQQYDSAAGEIYHYDFYRLEQPDDSLEVGIEESFVDGINLIEWPSKLGSYLPWDCLHITLALGEDEGDSRTLTLESDGPILERLTAGLTT